MGGTGTRTARRIFGEQNRVAICVMTPHRHFSNLCFIARVLYGYRDNRVVRVMRRLTRPDEAISLVKTTVYTANRVTIFRVMSVTHAKTRERLLVFLERIRGSLVVDNVFELSRVVPKTLYCRVGYFVIRAFTSNRRCRDSRVDTSRKGPVQAVSSV